MLKAVPAFFRPRLAAARAMEDPAAALAALPSVEMEAAAAGEEEEGLKTDADAVEQEQGMGRLRLVGTVASVVEGGALAPELLLELLAYLGGGRAAHP